jgi:hypothetical protein
MGKEKNEIQEITLKKRSAAHSNYRKRKGSGAVFETGLSVGAGVYKRPEYYHKGLFR